MIRSNDTRAAACIAALVLASLVSCVPPRPEPPLQLMPVQIDPSRFTLEHVALFHDPNAYGGERGVYVLRDKETGREWVGVSGIGISELGSHPAGKSRLQDER